jgi:hypothetical protein
MSTESGVLLWLVAALAGSMLFFGVVVAPALFRALPEDAAGRFLRAFFPKYYLWGLAITVIAALTALLSDWAIAALCLLIAVSFAYARQWLMPQINRARDAALTGDREASPRFERLHRFSVLINGLQLVVLLVIAGRLIW